MYNIHNFFINYISLEEVLAQLVLCKTGNTIDSYRELSHNITEKYFTILQQVHKKVSKRYSCNCSIDYFFPEKQAMCF